MKEYLAGLVTLLIADGLWLGVIMSSQYKKWFPDFLQTFNILPAGIFYLVYVLALKFLILDMGILAGLPKNELILRAGLFGAINYATYNLTNAAVRNSWNPVGLTVDIVWGGVVTSLVAYSILSI